jgi:hypothetical protein
MLRALPLQAGKTTPKKQPDPATIWFGDTVDTALPPSSRPFHICSGVNHTWVVLLDCFKSLILTVKMWTNPWEFICVWNFWAENFIGIFEICYCKIASLSHLSPASPPPALGRNGLGLDWEDPPPPSPLTSERSIVNFFHLPPPNSPLFQLQSPSHHILPCMPGCPPTPSSVSGRWPPFPYGEVPQLPGKSCPLPSLQCWGTLHSSIWIQKFLNLPTRGPYLPASMDMSYLFGVYKLYGSGSFWSLYGYFNLG